MSALHGVLLSVLASRFLGGVTSGRPNRAPKVSFKPIDRPSGAGYAHAGSVCLLAATLWLAAAGPAAAGGLSLSRVFSDNMVLQQGQTCPVFGADRPGTEVTVGFAGQRLATTAGVDGRWRVNLAPLMANTDSQTMVVVGSSRITLTNVLVGEVWLIAGQSNADWPLSSATGGGEALASATNSLIRYLHMAESPRTDAVAWSPAELARLNPQDYFSGAWQVNNASTAGAVSAIGYFFAREIAAHRKVPVGLIDCTVGGTPAVSWIPPEAINANPSLKEMADHVLQCDRVPLFARDRLLQNLAAWDKSGRPAPMPEHPYKPGACWRNGLAPIVPFALRGVLWYQGETDADFANPLDFDLLARWHTDTFKTLVTAWRSAWERSDLPVYFVQLPQMNRPSWPWFRESQAECARRIPQTAMAVAYDCGQPNNVHPPDKRPVAERLALLARRHTYGEEVEASGPTLRSCRVSDRSLILDFEHVAGGLVSSDKQPLRYFEVAGADRHFYSATALISNTTVLVSAPEVRRPVAVRYAWLPAGNVNFFNGVGLPASPFRTDQWTAVGRPLRVACIGDSITFGYGLTDTNQAYPARLQALLGPEFEVRNLGRNGATVTRDAFSGWARGYLGLAEHTNALAFQPDIVICNLGINDVSAFVDAQRPSFVDSYRQLISAYRTLRSAPRFILWQPLAPLFPGQTYYGQPVVTNVNNLIREVVDLTGAEALDMSKPLADHPEWFPDHLHPNAAGAARIAELTREFLQPPGKPLHP